MGCWDPTFSRSFNDSELKNVERLLRQLGGRRVIEGIEDMVRWMGEKNHFFFFFFSVLVLYKMMKQRHPNSFSWKSICATKG